MCEKEMRSEGEMSTERGQGQLLEWLFASRKLYLKDDIDVVVCLDVVEAHDT